ncbi:MAG: hypothetical protein CMG41_06330 [Candidatus Marinimicrobia bacterium]|nr:hypothetical protein [Candidatus Neomarinimicrobiota bacterium]
MPTWFLDIKIPLVQKRYEMGDLSNPDYNIYPTPDSMGFQIVYEADFPFTSLDPENLKIDFPGGYMETAIPASEMPGVDASGLELPTIPPIEFKIPLVVYDQLLYLDTAITLIPALDENGNPIPIFDEYYNIIGFETDTLVVPFEGVNYTGTPFSFPIDSVKTLSANFYNAAIATPANNFLDSLFGQINGQAPIDLGLNSLLPDTDPQLISSIDTINISIGDNSIYSTKIENRGIPTSISSAYSRLITGIEALDDTIANHVSSEINIGSALNETKDLGGEGLAQLLQITAGFQLDYASPGSFVTLYPPGNAEGNQSSDSLYIDFKIQFGLGGVESMDVSIDSVGLEIPKPEIPFAATENEDGSSTSLELYRTVLSSDNVPYTSNRLQVLDLTNTFPFNIKFLMDYKNFFVPSGNAPVKIDQILTPGETYNFDISLKGDTMRAANPDSAIDKLDLDLEVSIPTQKVTIPLDGSSLGGLGLTVRFGSLVFKELEANIVQGFPSVPQDQEMPQGFNGATLADVRLALIMKSQIKLPVRMNMDFKGVDVFGDTTRMNFAIDTIGYPPTDLDTSMTVIELNRYGTHIQIYDRTTDSIPSYDTIMAPAEGQWTIIDLMASNPTKLTIDAAAKIDGRGTIVAGAGLGGGFRLVAPFSLILDEMVFLSQPTVIEEMEYETRNKIRNSLISAEMVFDVMNAMPIGAELSMLLSNSEYFPTSGTPEMLLAFRDTMAIKQGWSPTDNVYILNRCSELSPKTSNIYIYDVMTDFSECIDGIPYIIRSDGSGVDTVISYVDTLFKFILPDPNRLYTSEDTLGFPEGMVAEPGNATYATGLDTNRVRLITDYGDHYVMPRFQINSTDSQMIYLSVNDHLEVGSFITFRVSSSGIFASANSELVIVKPNGGQTLYTDKTYDVQWRTYGEGISEVNIYYSTSSDTNISAAIEGYWAGVNGGIIAENVPSVAGLNTYEWDLSGFSEQDSLRIRIVSKEKVVLDPKTEEYIKAKDINGWYLKVRNSGRSSSISSVDQNFIGTHGSRLNWNQ